MKPRFSIERALADSAGLAFRRPLTTFVWGLIALLPAFAIVCAGVMLAGSSTLMSEDPAAFMDSGAAVTFDLFVNLANVAQMLTGAVVMAAVVRAVAVDHKRRRGAPPFLGLGVDELLTVAVCLALGIGFVAVFVLMALPGMAIWFAAYSTGAAAAWWGLGVYILVSVVGVAALAARLSLIIPASVMNRTLAFPEGWRLARGQVLRLLALAVLSWLIYVVVTFGFVIVALIVGLITRAATGWDPTTLRDVRQLSDIVLPWPVWAVGGVGLLALVWLQGFAQAIGAAPFASAYLQLTRPKSAPATDESPPDALTSPEI